MKILFHKLKAKLSDFFSDLKYDRHLSGVYKKANKRIKEAQGLAVERNGTVYVLPDPNVKGDFFCVVGRDIPELIRRRVFTKKMNGFFCIKNAIFIARPTGKNEKRNFKVPKEWLLQK